MIVIEQTSLALTAIVTIIMQLIFFIIAYALQFDKVTDFAGCTNFILIAWLTYGIKESFNLRSLIITILITLWGIRIASFLLFRILKTGKDDRFDDLRNNFLKFLGFWIFQMIWVFLVSIPVTLTNSTIYNNNNNNNNKFGNVLDIIGVILFFIGIIIEAISDQQKFNFNSNRQHSLDIMNKGLWKYSRHPNYFGEITLWWGIFILSLGSLFNNNQNIIWLGILSPLFTMFLLLFLSGIPQSEPSKDKKVIEKGNQQQKDDYFGYIDSTSPLIPLPPKLYMSIPLALKRILFFEYPMYRYKQKQP